MDMSKISAYTSSAAYAATLKATTKSKETESQESTAQSTATSSEDLSSGVIYEPSEEGQKLAQTITENSTDSTSIVELLKSDMEAQKQSLMDMVKEAMGQQVANSSIASEDDVWTFLASGDYTVTEAAKLKAQEAISEDGYWGVEQTSDRIVEFAKALAGDDVSKADTLLEAFKEGYKQATKTWGKDLPDISQQTYDAVEKKFEEWKSQASESDATTETQA